MDFLDPPPPYTPRHKNNRTSDERTEAHSPHPVSMITSSARRSMEDELRTLPDGWVRQYDPEASHQFYVDTSKNPPRSIWHHPYDDTEYLSHLSPSEIQFLEAPIHGDRLNSLPSPSSTTLHYGQDETGSVRPGIQKFGRKLKDIITGTTHEERAKARQERDDFEIEAYRQHQHIRDKMSQASRTGEPQLLGIDCNGKEIWIKVPTINDGRSRLNNHPFENINRTAHIGFGTSSLEGHQNWNRYSENPYFSRYAGGSNLGYDRPYDAYHRPTGSGFGGGIGLPIGLGLAGGTLFGGMLF